MSEDMLRHRELSAVVLSARSAKGFTDAELARMSKVNRRHSWACRNDSTEGNGGCGRFDRRMSWVEFKEFVQMNHDFVNAAQEGLKARKRADDVAAEVTTMLTQKYPGYSIALAKAKENVALVYDDIYRSGHYVQ